MPYQYGLTVAFSFYLYILQSCRTVKKNRRGGRKSIS